MTGSHSDVILDRLTGLHPKLIDLNLERMNRLLAALGHPEMSLPPVVHIAGTNGKGSTAAMIRKGLETAGNTVHVYTSPHLVRFHERIRVAGSLIPEQDLTALLEECEDANKDDPITVFEITTCATFLAFSRTPADYTILEVGLGGRLDATNVVASPAVSVITPVSLDHQQYLGNSLREIAWEKAGILKRNTLGVVTQQSPEALEVIQEVAVSVGATLKVEGHHWHVWESDDGNTGFQDEYGFLDLPRPSLPGRHQIGNAGCAAAVLRILRLDGNSVAAAIGGVSSNEWPARMQRVRDGDLSIHAPEARIWLDGGHNPAAGLALARTLEDLPAGQSTHLVCGMMNSKDPASFLEPFVGLVDSVTGVVIPGETASRPADDIALASQDLGIRASTADGIPDAVKAITSRTPGARILICGSLYLAGALLESFEPGAVD
ncbi:MAG: bifunctional folylpolyglutamate synthase/dihydrofolate synthase [Rhodobacteraceae bacterium]|nr:bifunctional folylpolyglutamate synthase/dihydrofolate synthase [Paracoccaceae bacterium]